jgi:excisionase family DNA binding protein
VSQPLTVAVAADELGVTERQVRRMIAGGTLKASVVGKRTYVVDRRSLELLKRRREHAAAVKGGE